LRQDRQRALNKISSIRGTTDKTHLTRFKRNINKIFSQQPREDTAAESPVFV
jgi:hypothetical protein